MKKLDEKELKDVNGGVSLPALSKSYKCNDCGLIFNPDQYSDQSCTKCHSTNIVPYK